MAVELRFTPAVATEGIFPMEHGDAMAAGPHQIIDNPVDLRLPLTMLMAMLLLVFKVRPDEQDARASLPVTVLLTLVFLQQAYRDDLPDLSFLTFLDQVSVVA